VSHIMEIVIIRKFLRCHHRSNYYLLKLMVTIGDKDCEAKLTVTYSR
jgi:hypothetical protein